MTIKALSQLILQNLNFFIHTSPRQVLSTEQPWIPQEFGIFMKKLEENSVKFTKKMYFEDKPKTIEWHFKVLDQFEVPKEQKEDK